jgi:ribosome-associated protein
MAGRRSVEQAETDDEAASGERPSKSSRKRAAHAAQALGERLIELREQELAALQLPEPLADAIRAARRIRSRGGLARQRQYIGKLMRDVDPAPIEAALSQGSRDSALETERFRRLEAWRERLIDEGQPALDALRAWREDVDLAALARVVERARTALPGSEARTLAARELFRLLRGVLG